MDFSYAVGISSSWNIIIGLLYFDLHHNNAANQHLSTYLYKFHLLKIISTLIFSNSIRRIHKADLLSRFVHDLHGRQRILKGING